MVGEVGCAEIENISVQNAINQVILHSSAYLLSLEHALLDKFFSMHLDKKPEIFRQSLVNLVPPQSLHPKTTEAHEPACAGRVHTVLATDESILQFFLLFFFASHFGNIWQKKMRYC